MDGRPLPQIWATIGRLLRATPHFKHKWRICAKLLGRFLRHREYTTVVTFDRGQRMVVNLDDVIQYQVFLTGFYDVETVHTRFFRRCVRRGMVVCDVGANVGYYTLQAASRVGETGEVHAFEPASEAFERLTLNLRLEQPTLQLLIEVSEKTLRWQGLTPGELFDYLDGFGFVPFRITSRGLRPMPRAGFVKESLVLFRKPSPSP